MKKIVYFLATVLTCLNSHLTGDENLINQVNSAVEIKDVTLILDSIDAILDVEGNAQNLINLLVQYADNGKSDFSLYNAIEDNNFLASLILTHYSKDVNKRKDGYESVYESKNPSAFRWYKAPLELALDKDMVGLIPYLLTHNANPYAMRGVSFLYQDEENLLYLEDIGVKHEKKVCSKSLKEYFSTYYYDSIIGRTRCMERTFIGDVIAKDRLDVLEIVDGTIQIDWDKTCCKTQMGKFTPLQFALISKRYEIAAFIIDHGARF